MNAQNFKVKFISDEGCSEIEAVFSSEIQAINYVVQETKKENIELGKNWANVNVNTWTDKNGCKFEIC